MTHQPNTASRDEELRQQLADAVFGRNGCSVGSVANIKKVLDELEEVTTQQLKAFKEAVEEALPEERTRRNDLDNIIKHELFQFDDNPRQQRLIAIGKINGFNTALDQSRSALSEAFDKFTKEKK